MSDFSRVVKVGGSLLDWPRLPVALSEWLEQQSPRAATTLLIAGGGSLVDAIREADRQFELNDEAAHWLSIRAMELTARLLAELLPEASLETDLWNLKRSPGKSASTRLCIGLCLAFLEREEAGLPGEAMPRDWRATSDSIAARIATALAADELVLLKSTDIAVGVSKTTAAAAKLVDAFFPSASRGLPAVRWVNLRTRNEASLLPG